MSTEVGKLYYDLSVDDKSLSKGLDSADDKVSKFGDKMSSMGKTVAVGVGVAAAATVAFGVKSVQAFAEAEEVMAQTEAVIRSTGGAAGVTADQVSQLASSFQATTKFADEAVQSGENILLTFTNIGKDIFPLATQTMLDMSQALGQDVKSSAIQLGKALQDPVKGVSALSRVGVNFSEKQKTVIENLVNTGKAAEAQKMILKELQTEFGGSAEAAGQTLAGKLVILQNTFGDLMEVIGKGISKVLGPLIDKMLEWYDSIGGAEGLLSKLKDTFEKLRPYWGIMAGAILGILVPALIVGTMWMWSFIEPFVIFAGIGALVGLALKTLIEKLGGMTVIMQKLQPVIAVLGGLWRDLFYPALLIVAGVVRDYLLPALMRLWETIRPLAPILLVIAAVVVGSLLVSLMAFIGTVIAVSYVVSILIGWISNLINWIGNVAGVLRNAANNVIGFFADVLGAVQRVVAKIKDIWGGLGGSLRSAVSGITDIIFLPFKTAFNMIAKAWNNTVGRISFEAPNWVPGGIGGKKFSVPKVPEFNKGVENFGGGLAYVHQGEMLMNLAPGTDVIKKSDVQSMMGSGGGGSNVTINLSGIMTESREGTRQVARTLIQALNEGLKAKGMEEIQL